MFQVHGALLLLALAGQSPQDATDTDADDPGAVVFVADACGAGEGAPPKGSLGKLVILTDLDQGDPYHAVVEVLTKAKRPAAVVRFATGRIGGARDELLRLLPEFVIVVTRPEHIDVNVHFELLETAASLDADPFVDFAFGYVTGANPAEALAFARRIVAIGAKAGAVPKRIVQFGPASSGASSFGDWLPHKLAKGFREMHAWHGPVGDLLAKKDLLRGAGILCAGGHGMPDGIVDGLSGEDLRKHGIDLSPAIYFSGPCYCGVTGPWFDVSAGAPVRKTVDPSKSFALAAIASGVTALFAGLDPDRGETCSQELEHLLIHGDALGHASKETFDGAVVALRRPALELFRYTEGAGRPQRNLADTMIGGGASRALFGDPTCAPFPPSAERTFPVARKDGPRGLELTWTSEQGPTGWSSVDVYRCDGGWTHRIAFKELIPVGTARKLESFSLARLTAKDEPLDGRFATAMVERWGGKAYLHVYVVFPPAGQQNVFFVKRDFTARFVFAK
jgi:hypothetical protein